MLSIIIPARNEAHNIRILLDSIANQTYRDYEIIVADAGSSDGTPDIARQYGAKVVRGGLPAFGRNAGAVAAKSDWLLFVDADCSFAGTMFLANALSQLSETGAGIATVRFNPRERSLLNTFLVRVCNLYLSLSSFAKPLGFCALFVKKDAFIAVGGFDEAYIAGEDIELVRKVVRSNRFAILESTLEVSMRRFRYYGYVRASLKYLYCLALFEFRREKLKNITYRFDHLEGKEPVA